MADHPVPALDNKTPLMVARKPAMDQIARKGATGQLQTIEADMPTGSAVANLSVLGYDPRKTFQGRGVLEAASLGVSMNDDDLAMRVNLVNIKNDQMNSHSAGHISDSDAGQLIQDLQEYFGETFFQLTQGLSYRHVLVLPGGDPNVQCFPPHDHIGEFISNLQVSSLSASAEPTAVRLNELIRDSQKFLLDHPVNKKRISENKLAANALWPWSPGVKPIMQTIFERFNVTGAAISAVDLIKGMAIYAGMQVIPVKGATGLYDTNYEGKADACLQALKTHDFVYVHVESPDEAGHDRNLDLKIKCIEDLDRRLIQRILDGIEQNGLMTVVAVLPDHATPVSHGAHTRDPVPVAIWDPASEPDAVQKYDEESVKLGSLGFLHGSDFIEKVFKNHVQD